MSAAEQSITGTGIGQGGNTLGLSVVGEEHGLNPSIDSSAPAKKACEKNAGKQEAGLKWEETKVEVGTFKVLTSRVDKTITKETFAELKEFIQSGGEVARIDIYADSDSRERFSPDGELRCMVFEELKRPVPVRIANVKNAYRKAYVESLKANSQNGRQRTNADKRAQVTKALEDPEFERFNPVQISRLTGTSHTFVSNIIREREASQFGEQVSDEEAGTSDTDSSDQELQKINESLVSLTSNTDWVPSASDFTALRNIRENVKSLFTRQPKPSSFDMTGLREFKEKFALNDSQIAVLVGVNPTTISRWFDGKANLSKHHVQAVKRTLVFTGDQIDKILGRNRNG